VGCNGPGHPAWGHPTREFSGEKCIGICLKLREIKATAPGIQDKGASKRSFCKRIKEK